MGAAAHSSFPLRALRLDIGFNAEAKTALVALFCSRFEPARGGRAIGLAVDSKSITYRSQNILDFLRTVFRYPESGAAATA